MRYQASWNADQTDQITDQGQANLAATLARAVEVGITHIETARGYGTSELQIGRALPDLPRERIILQTKLPPTDTGQQFAQTFEESLERLGVDRVELLSIHGINDAACLGKTMAPGGPMDVAERLRLDGRVGHLGFSTHGPTEVILDTIRTGRFEYVNLHWYWIFQENLPAVLAARDLDMGVFIISPNDKGGKLYAPSDKLAELTQPLGPMAWNDLFCLARPEVHTLSIGAARPEDFDAHLRAVELLDDPAGMDRARQITLRVQQAMVEALGRDWLDTWHVCLPAWQHIPGQVNVRVIVWLWNLVQGLDLVEYARSRYNLLGNGGHWFPGEKAADFDPAAMRKALSASPHADRIVEILAEADERLGGQEVQRLQEE
jgi:hypothetical protein